MRPKFILFLLTILLFSKAKAQFQIIPLPDTISHCSDYGMIHVANEEGSYDFVWKFNGVISSVNGSAIRLDKAGLYSVEIFDQQNLIYSDSCLVLESAVIFKERTDSLFFCEGDSLVFTSPSSYKGAWFVNYDDGTYESVVNDTIFVLKKPAWVEFDIYGMGCFVIDCFVVVMNPLNYNFLGDDKTFVDSILLDAGEGKSYLWSTGQSTRYITYKDSSSYISVSVVNMNDCISSDTIKVEKIKLGINNKNSSRISIYPNPTQNKIFIHGVMNGARVKLLDVNSRCLETIIIDSSFEIDISKYDSGIYLLQTDEFITKIVKQ